VTVEFFAAKKISGRGHFTQVHRFAVLHYRVLLQQIQNLRPIVGIKTHLARDLCRRLRELGIAYDNSVSDPTPRRSARF